ncbi:MAG: S8 family serine peptidase [Planctomycetota bacterium]|jgi:subtilisin family serine protease
MSLTVLTAVTLGAGTALGDDHFVANQCIVRLEPEVDIAEINAEYDTTVLGYIPSEELYLLELHESISEEQFEETIQHDPRIANAELNHEGDSPEGGSQSIFMGINGAAFPGQWAWEQIGLELAHEVSTGVGVIVAVLDTGLDAEHECVAGRVLPGYNLLDQTSDTSDVGNALDDDNDGLVDEAVGHGTFVAGLIAHTAPSAWLLPVKVLDSDGNGNSFHIAQGILWAVEQGADVINLSLCTSEPNEIIAQAIVDAYDAGVILIAAAGNDAIDDPVVFPAGESKVFGVAAVDQTDHKAGFSNFNSEISLAAPGVEIISAMPRASYASWEGTSMATALVSGAAAILRSAYPSAAVTKIEDALTESAVNIDEINPEHAGLLGAGRLDIPAALQELALQAPRAGDLNEDGDVDIDDLLLLLLDWGAADSPADLDGSGLVDVDDLVILLMNMT